MTRRDRALFDLHQIQREANIPANRRFFPSDHVSEDDIQQFIYVMTLLFQRTA